MSRLIICDIDNCIADDAWRIPFIDWDKGDPDARYHVYHTLGIGDAPDAAAWLTQERNTAQAEHVHFFTARAVRYSKLTHWWLEDATGMRRGKDYTLHMRNNGDHRSSVEVKRNMLSHLFGCTDAMPGDIAAAYDDREDVVAMYRECNIPAHVRAVHNKCAWTDPRSVQAPPATVPDILRSGAATYEARNAVYGDNYKHFGTAMAGMFPAGLSVRSAEEWNRLGLLIQCASKLTRYAGQFTVGGHADSAHDLSVYAAMLQEMTG